MIAGFYLFVLAIDLLIVFISCFLYTTLKSIVFALFNMHLKLDILCDKGWTEFSYSLNYCAICLG